MGGKNKHSCVLAELETGVAFVITDHAFKDHELTIFEQYQVPAYPILRSETVVCPADAVLEVLAALRVQQVSVTAVLLRRRDGSSVSTAAFHLLFGED